MRCVPELKNDIGCHPVASVDGKSEDGCCEGCVEEPSGPPWEGAKEEASPELAVVRDGASDHAFDLLAWGVM